MNGNRPQGRGRLSLVLVGVGVLSILGVLLIRGTGSEPREPRSPRDAVRRPAASDRAAGARRVRDDDDRSSAKGTEHSSADGTEQSTLRGRVVGPEDEPISDATVSLLRLPREAAMTALLEAAAEETVASADDGSFQFRPPTATEPWLVRAAKEGFTLGHRSVPLGARRQEIVLRLDPSATLRGRVINEKGRPVSDALIWVWKSRDVPPFDPVAMHPDPAQSLDGVRRTESGPDGHFRFADLAPNTVYRVVASSRYRVLSVPFVEARADDSPVELVLHRLYLLWGKIVEKDGSRLALDPRADLVSGVGVLLTPPAGAPGFLYSRSLRLRDAGLELPSVLRGPRVSDREHVLLWFVSDKAVDKIGPYEARIELPGYRVAQYPISARWIGHRPVRPTPLPLGRSAASFGTLQVGFEQAGGGMSDVELPEDFATLLLLSDDPVRKAIRIGLHRVGAPMALQVPSGPYRVRLTATVPGFTVEQARIEVTRQKPANLSITVPRLHRVLVEVTTEPSEAIRRLLANTQIVAERAEPTSPKLRVQRYLTDYIEPAFLLPDGKYRVTLRPLFAQQALQFTVEDVTVDTSEGDWHVVLKVSGIR